MLMVVVVHAMLVDSNFLGQPLMQETETLTMDSLANSLLDFEMCERNFETFVVELDAMKEEDEEQVPVVEGIDWIVFF